MEGAIVVFELAVERVLALVLLGEVVEMKEDKVMGVLLGLEVKEVPAAVTELLGVVSFNGEEDCGKGACFSCCGERKLTSDDGATRVDEAGLPLGHALILQISLLLMLLMGVCW